MKKILYLIFIFNCTIFSSCNDSNDNENQNTILEGVWKLQNIPNGTKITFENQNWKLESGNVIITGEFSITGNQINAEALNRYGTNNEVLQPNTFTGNFQISNNKVNFTNFSGNWYGVFSSWYQKQ